MDAGTAKKYHFSVGQSVRVLFGGPTRTFTITGIVQFGTADNLAGVTVAAFDLPTAQDVLGEVGQLDHINVVSAPDANKAAVGRAIARVLPPGVEVVTGQTVLDEQTSSINQSLSFFSTALLVFAFISLFVGAFTIFNTFSITVGQRTRELAMLRVVGASRRQVSRSVLGEAAIVGVVSSLIGTGLGVLAAVGLEALLSAFGFTLPSGPLVFEAADGGGRPGRRCRCDRHFRHQPGAPSGARPAHSGYQRPSGKQRGPSPPPLARGAAVALVGGVLLVLGLSLPAIALVGAGAAAIFVGAAMLAPAVARPLSSAIGRPLARALGAPGKLGRENSMRSPRRTAQTASALMIGIALVSAMAVFGASVSRSATSSVDDAISADVIVSGTSNGSGSFSRSLADAVTRVPGVRASLIAYGGQFEVRQSLENLKGVSTRGLSETVILRMTAGSVGALAAGDLLIDSTTAKSDHLDVGSTVPVKFALTGSTRMRIGGIYKANALIGSYVVSQAFYLSHYQDPLPGAVLLKTASSSAVEREVNRLLAPYPTVQVQTRAQFDKSQVSSVNQLLGLIYALLALAVVIALVGIVNTLMLSVFERTREIGLLRAVGMKRRQVRTMVRTESVILSVFGAIIGIVIGTGMGIALVSSLKLTDMVVPTSSLIVFLFLSAVLGLVAATWPARRAARLDVLAAIAAE